MLRLPDRAGQRPATSAELPHRQLDQVSPQAVYDLLSERMSGIDGCERGPSTISVPGSRALFLPGCRTCNERFGFIRGREFAHLHPPGDGSLHVALAPDDVQEVLARGWGEFHPWVASGRVLPNVVMVYAPRTVAEAQVVLAIIRASLDNARRPVGQPTGGH